MNTEEFINQFGKTYLNKDGNYKFRSMTSLRDFVIAHFKMKVEPGWGIEFVDRYWYTSGRNSLTYVEVTFWFNSMTSERKETKREAFIFDGQQYKLPDWAKSVKENRMLLNDEKFY